jgi:hypothetical protein
MESASLHHQENSQSNSQKNTPIPTNFFLAKNLFAKSFPNDHKLKWITNGKN